VGSVRKAAGLHIDPETAEDYQQLSLPIVALVERQP
jgi:hypothetical protein